MSQKRHIGLSQDEEWSLLIIQFNHIGLSAGRVLLIQLLKQKERDIQV